ncbi:MAG: hypothetical protein JWM99_3992 [Verrucomicrobiales bacterium]|nr:hypothetical protein [Verrucomicrobiales bacterium]
MVKRMTGLEVIEEIKRLPKKERVKVIEYARAVDNEQLSPDELVELIRKMVEEPDPGETKRLKEEIFRGFYGDEPHA